MFKRNKLIRIFPLALLTSCGLQHKSTSDTALGMRQGIDDSIRYRAVVLAGIDTATEHSTPTTITDFTDRGVAVGIYVLRHQQFVGSRVHLWADNYRAVRSSGFYLASSSPRYPWLADGTPLDLEGAPLMNENLTLVLVNNVGDARPLMLDDGALTALPSPSEGSGYSTPTAMNENTMYGLYEGGCSLLCEFGFDFLNRTTQAASDAGSLFIAASVNELGQQLGTFYPDAVQLGMPAYRYGSDQVILNDRNFGEITLHRISRRPWDQLNILLSGNHPGAQGAESWLTDRFGHVVPITIPHRRVHAADMNDRGMIIARSTLLNGMHVSGLLYSSHQAEPLLLEKLTLDPGPTNNVLSVVPLKLNNVGQIVAQVLFNGAPSAYAILTPIIIDENEQASPACVGIQAGDANGDGDVNNFDIDAFVMYLADSRRFLETFRSNPLCSLDMDGSGTIDNYDIDPFVARINL